MVKAYILLLYNDSIQRNKFSCILISGTVNLYFLFAPDKIQTFTDNFILSVYKKTSRGDAKKSLSIMNAFIHISYQISTLLNVKANYFISVTLMAGPLPEE